MNLRRLKAAETAFLRRYPGGFENPELAALRERKHKPDRMVALARESFSKRNFAHPELIVQNMSRVITRSSIVSVFEKSRLRDAMSTLLPEEREWVSRGLEQALHGDEQAGFEMLLELLRTRRLAKWTLMTVCQTYYHPQRDVFVKPTTVKGIIQYFELENLQYRPTPTWGFYETYRSAFLRMKSNVDPSLAPTNPAFSGFLLMSIHSRLF